MRSDIFRELQLYILIKIGQICERILEARTMEGPECHVGAQFLQDQKRGSAISVWQKAWAPGRCCRTATSAC